ncbi:hypothetical protein CBM2588_A160036 [Cupriavidus taiwanensis]|nr:hypothetical protein CBM2588_A160036 [Cupriavidus taiwanensis]
MRLVVLESLSLNSFVSSGNK